MSNRRYLIYSKPFSEYAYRIIKESNATQRSNLSETDMKILRNDATMREFVHNSPLEQILMLLTTLGKTWDLRMYDNEAIADQLEYNVVNQFQFPEKRIDIIEAAAREKIHHLSSNDTMLSAMMCAQNVHTKVYHLSASSRDAISKVYSFKKKRYDQQIEDSEDAMDELNNLLLNQLNSLEWARETLGLEQNDIRILCSLFNNRHGAMTMQEIAKGTLMEGRMAYLKKNVEKLMLNKLIVSDATHGHKVQVNKGKKAPMRSFFMISTPGVQKVMQYRNYIHSLTFGVK